MLIVGSYALAHTDYHLRAPNDIDVICHKYDFKKIVEELMKSNYAIKEIMFTTSGAYVKAIRDNRRIIVECSFLDLPHALQQTDQEIYDYSINLGIRRATTIGTCFIAPISIVYLMKYSHRFKKDSPHFLKTLRDTQELEKTAGDELVEVWQDLEWQAMLQRREQSTYTNNLPKLNTSKKERILYRFCTVQV